LCFGRFFIQIKSSKRPRSKLQRNSKSQGPNEESQDCSLQKFSPKNRILEIGFSLDLGVWNLELLNEYRPR
jgi:hypothetical protein